NPQRSLGVSTAPGVIVFSRVPAIKRQLIWFDRSGTKLGTVGEAMTDWGIGGRLSPNGATVAISLEPHGRQSIWLMDVARGTMSRLAADGSRPIWSPK